MLPGEIGSNIPEFLTLTKHALGHLDTGGEIAAGPRLLQKRSLSIAGLETVSYAAVSTSTNPPSRSTSSP